MSKALCPGSFDPLTLGHYDIIKRCSEIFDEVVVLVGCNAQKKGLLTNDKRVEFALDAFQNEKNINVVAYDGLLIDYINEHNIDVIVKGLRNTSDLEYENEMANTNLLLSMNKYGKSVETMYLPSSSQYAYTSSSLVRQLIEMNLPINNYVHNPGLLYKLLKD